MSALKEGKGPLVPETILKRKHDLDELKAKREANKNRRGNRKVFRKNKTIKIIKPEKFLMDSRNRANHTRRFHRVKKLGMQKRASDSVLIKERETEESRQNPDVTIEPIMEKYQANSVKAKFVFVIRIRGSSKRVPIPSQIRKTLFNMRLRSQYDGVFLKYNEITRKMLQLVEPFVVYGTLSKSSVQNLITRRGHCKVDGKRVPISDNIVIEEKLGDEHGIICVEDLVHEIFSVGDSFKHANSFLWPFQLSAPKSKFEKNTLKYKEGGKNEYGDQGEAMDEVLRSML